jgi:AcrR family transcriptional regulator
MNTRGRPRLVSAELLAEAATELFLEQGYHHTVVDEIAARAGVSRATFFNYFPTKADVLFAEVDRYLAELEQLVEKGMDVVDGVAQIAGGFSRRNLPLIVSQSEAMDVRQDIRQVGPARFERLRSLVASQYPDPLDHWVLTAAIVSAALSWAAEKDTGVSLIDAINQSIATVARGMGQLLD